MNEKYLAPNSLLGNRYVIVRLLAEGGMGTVYEARDQRLGGIVALKKTIFTDEYFRNQFEREARLLANLRHIGLPRVIDQFIDENGQFLVMEFIAGQDLKSLLDERRRPFPHDEVLVWGEQLLNILYYLHSKQPPVFHRDIKPQNLKLNDEGLIILLDFGLAKGAAPGMTHVAAGNTLLGCTPSYAPLEQLIRIDQFMHLVVAILKATEIEQIKQIMSEYTDARTDLYSLAATMYHLMTGVVPVNAIERFLATAQGRPDPLLLANQACPDVPSHVTTFLMQAMAIKREKRFASAVAMRTALHEITRLTNPPSSNNEKRKSRLNFKGVKGDPINGTPPSHKNKETNLRPRLNFKGVKGAADANASPQPAPGNLKLNSNTPSKKGGSGMAKRGKPEALKPKR